MKRLDLDKGSTFPWKKKKYWISPGSEFMSQSPTRGTWQVSASSTQHSSSTSYEHQRCKYPVNIPLWIPLGSFPCTFIFPAVPRRAFSVFNDFFSAVQTSAFSVVMEWESLLCLMTAQAPLCVLGEKCAGLGKGCRTARLPPVFQKEQR